MNIETKVSNQEVLNANSVFDRASNVLTELQAEITKKESSFYKALDNLRLVERVLKLPGVVKFLKLTGRKITFVNSDFFSGRSSTLTVSTDGLVLSYESQNTPPVGWGVSRVGLSPWSWVRPISASEEDLKALMEHDQGNIGATFIKSFSGLTGKKIIRKVQGVISQPINPSELLNN